MKKGYRYPVFLGFAQTFPNVVAASAQLRRSVYPTPKHIFIPVTKKTTHNSKFATFVKKLGCSTKKKQTMSLWTNLAILVACLSDQAQRKHSVFAGCWVYKASRVLSHDYAWSWCMRRRWMDAGHEDRWFKGIISKISSQVAQSFTT